MIAPRCRFCWAIWFAVFGTLLYVALWLLTNSHETAGGWTLAAALLFVFGASCTKSCYTPDEMARWDDVKRRKNEAECEAEEREDRSA